MNARAFGVIVTGGGLGLPAKAEAVVARAIGFSGAAERFRFKQRVDCPCCHCTWTRPFLPICRTD